jgi:hypothetical protein
VPAGWLSPAALCCALLLPAAALACAAADELSRRLPCMHGTSVFKSMCNAAPHMQVKWNVTWQRSDSWCCSFIKCDVHISFADCMERVTHPLARTQTNTRIMKVWRQL